MPNRQPNNGSPPQHPARLINPPRFKAKDWLLHAGIAIICLLLTGWEPNSSELLQYDRQRVMNGEIWRLLSCHLVHLSWPHSLLNVTGLLIITGIFQQELAPKYDMMALLFLGVVVGLGIHLFVPTIGWYVGLSGVLYGYFIYFLLVGYKLTPTISLIGLALITAKIGWDQTPWANTQDTAELIGGAVAVKAHLIGGIGGYVAGGVAWIRLNKVQKI